MILVVLDAAEKVVASIKATGEIKINEIEKMLDFFRNPGGHCSQNHKLLRYLSKA